MFHLKYTEFYITNVCNLNCPNCNRFNNYAFSGHQRWSDYSAQYEQWAKIINFDRIGILGGEPLLNPDLINWITGIADLWPDSQLIIITNGTQFERWKELYDLVKEKKISIELNYHGHEQKKYVEPLLEKWLTGPINKQYAYGQKAIDLWAEAYKRIADPTWPECKHPYAFDNLPAHIKEECETQHNVSLKVWQDQVFGQTWTDHNQVKVKVSMSNSFNISAVQLINGQLMVSKNNPEQAFEICYSKSCHHFIRGKLYKCGTVGILPEFIKQFNVDISDDDLALLNSYQPAEPTWAQNQLENFINNLSKEVIIDQCRLCPDKLSPTKFEAGTKKVKFIKKPIDKV